MADVVSTGINQASTSPFMWISLLLTVVAVVSIVGFVIYKILSGKDITTKAFTATQKVQIQADSRELSDNQMRAAKVILGKLKVLLCTEADVIWTSKTSLETDYISLLLNHITTHLLEQYRIDLVRNHIMQKNYEELKIYSDAKAVMYRMKVESFLNDYNRCIPQYDLKRILDNVPENTFKELYYQAYSQAKSLSVGY